MTGQHLQQLRLEAGLTQSELAERLFVSRELVAKWETGARRPDYKTMLALAALYGVGVETIVPPDELLLRELSDCIPVGREADAEQIRDALNGFLRSLPEREAAVFIRRYYHMEAPAEIACFFGIKTQNVYLILSRVRKKLRKYFSEVLR